MAGVFSATHDHMPDAGVSPAIWRPAARDGWCRVATEAAGRVPAARRSVFGKREARVASAVDNHTLPVSCPAAGFAHSGAV